MKELKFFIYMESLPDYRTHPWLKGRVVYELDQYLKHFEEAKEGQVMGEVCPFYLLSVRINKDRPRNLLPNIYPDN
jgi:hypothetical protein